MPSESTGDGLMSERAPLPVGPYPHARRIGNLVFLSGVGPRKRDSKEIPGVTLDENGAILVRHRQRQLYPAPDNRHDGDGG